MLGYITILWILWVFGGVVGASFILGEFIGYGPMFATIPVGFLIAIGFYYCVWFYFLSLFLGQLKYKLNSISPIHSETISVLQTIFNKHLYILAVFFACATFVFSQVGLTRASMPFIVIAWLIFIIQFIANRSAINRIMSEAKWKTLNKIQAQINQIEKNEDLSEKGVNEKLFRLVDTYERIRVTSTNKLEIKSILNFFSQMMLPLLGLLLGNLDKLIEFLS